MPPNLIRPKRYLVELDTGDTFECRVIAADILKAEETSPTYGIIGDRSPIALTLVWVWAAARREGHISWGWPEFRNHLVDWLDLARAKVAPEEAPVDPTQPAGSTPWPTVSAPTGPQDLTSTGGNEPSSTTPN